MHECVHACAGGPNLSISAIVLVDKGILLLLQSRCSGLAQLLVAYCTR
jgi:hypothetical protein